MVKQLTDFEKGWLSAFIDGEGSIFIQMSNGHLQPVLSVSNTNTEILEKFKTIVDNTKDEKVNIAKWNFKYGNTRKIGYRVRIFNYKTIINLLEELLPYLIVKRKQAELLLKYFSERKMYSKADKVEKERRLFYWNEMHKLNKKGRLNEKI